MTVGITEPMTLVTDYALGTLAAVCAVMLWHATRPLERAVTLATGAFIFTAVAALAGGTSHGFASVLAAPIRMALWKATVYSIGLGSFFLLAATLVSTIRRPVRDWLLAAAALKFIVYAVWMATHDEFRYVIVDYAASMVAVLVLQARAWHRHQPGAGLIVVGILVSFAAAAVQQSGIGIHRHFNHNDLYHVIQMGALWSLYKGSRFLRDRE